LNNRPFGTGAHFTLKKTLLNVFVSTEDIDSAGFNKYVARIAKAWGMHAVRNSTRDTIDMGVLLQGLLQASALCTSRTHRTLQ